MIRVIFKNLEPSELARDIVLERMEGILEKFSDLHDARILVTLEMLNSPGNAGPDLFDVKVQVLSGRYRGVRMRKSSPQLYAALADVVEHLLERLNRFGDRARVKARRSARRVFSPPLVPRGSE